MSHEVKLAESSSRLKTLSSKHKRAPGERSPANEEAHPTDRRGQHNCGRTRDRVDVKRAWEEHDAGRKRRAGDAELTAARYRRGERHSRNRYGMQKMVVGAGIEDLEGTGINPSLQAMRTKGAHGDGQKSIDRADEQPKVHVRNLLSPKGRS